MSRKTFIQLAILILCLPLGEVYGIFRTPELRERCWFIASNVKQDIEWYIKDSGEAVTWIVFLTIWYIRESSRAIVFSRHIAAFLLFRWLDFGMYWFNHRATTGGYIVCYILLLFSMVLIAKKR